MPPSANVSAAFTAVAALAGALLGVGRSRDSSSGWAAMDVNMDDPVEVALASRVQQPEMANKADSTALAYVGPWNAFVRW